MLFPRMGSIGNRDHARAYRTWLDMNEKSVPTFGDNIRFFLKYQIGYMYFRYFFWNFAGRQDDMQGHVQRGRTNGNWLTGINSIDRSRIGPEYDRPESTNNKARNNMYMIPFFLGLIGLLYHYREDKKGTLVLFLLLLLYTGFMNIINANEPPFEPRERDYALVYFFLQLCYVDWFRSIGYILLAFFKTQP